VGVPPVPHAVANAAGAKIIPVNNATPNERAEKEKNSFLKLRRKAEKGATIKSLPYPRHESPVPNF
jgi:hypothetical protein